MSFTVQSALAVKVKDKYGKNTKAVAEALLELCPMLTLETVTEDTDAKYSAILRICKSDLAINIHNFTGTAQIQFAAGKYSEGKVNSAQQKNTDGRLLECGTNAPSAVEIAMYTLNDAASILKIGANTSSPTYFTVGKLKSQSDGEERIFFTNNLGSSTENGIVLTDINSVVTLAAVRNTLSGHTGALGGTNMPTLVMTPVYPDCALQFLGLPTIGGGTMYYTNQSFASYALCTISGRQFFFVAPNVCIDVS